MSWKEGLIEAAASALHTGLFSLSFPGTKKQSSFFVFELAKRRSSTIKQRAGRPGRVGSRCHNEGQGEMAEERGECGVCGVEDRLR